MELHQIRYFLALCEEKNFTRAARRCGVSQPSLSNAIKRLEQELGGQLFHRRRTNCLLSELGQEVRPHLAKLDQCVSDARKQAVQFLAAPQATAREQVPSVDRPLIHGSLEFNRNSRTKEHQMRKPIYFIGAWALAIAAIVAWSQPALVSSKVNTAWAFISSQRPSSQAATPTTRAISPTDITISYDKPLPVEQWDAF